MRQGFLENLELYDWEQAPSPPQPWHRVVAVTRGALQAALWLTAHPFIAVAFLLGTICLFTI